jgi:hypothetical protein
MACSSRMTIATISHASSELRGKLGDGMRKAA